MRPHPLLLSILAVLPGCSETFVTDGCLAVEDDATTCPAPQSVSLDDLFLVEECGSDIELVEIKGDGKLRSGTPDLVGSTCCYPVEVIDHEPNDRCVVGRPYLERGRAQLAPIAQAERARVPSVRAAAWASAGSAEHASVAAFNRLSLQLLALGAPLALLTAVQQAAMDEVQHARACLELANKLGDSEFTLGAFPFSGTVDPHVKLADLAYAAVREGCLAETLGACVVSNVAELVTDEPVRVVLQRLAREESNHAVLSFRIVSWALQTGGDTVREAVTRALQEPWPQFDVDELALRTGLSKLLIARAASDAYRRVLTPATNALLSC